ncbi:MAG: AGE family epimerase/isomerase [Candidatus Caccosoma sp.]|nr:AGE family epimerase/isomerase [Candidatus Caccosoma sp.]
MEKKYFEDLLNFYESELDQTLDFWYSYGYDKNNGGFFTCLERDGTVYDTDKAVWAQGRGMWVFAKAYNFIKKDPRYLKASMDAYDFVTKHCFDTDGRMFFTVTEKGVGIQKRRYWFSESFTVVGSIELYRATKDVKYLNTARNTFDTMLKVKTGVIKTEPKFNPEVVNCIALASPMILLVTCQILRDVDKEKEAYYNKIIDDSIEEIKLHYHPECKAVFENVNPDGTRCEGSRGRLVNPGHSIEASWFLMNESAYRNNDPKLLEMALNILEWSFELGWDYDVGGLRYFVDVEGKPVQALEWDMKLWWPHNEMLIAFLMAYKHTHKQKYLDKYQLVHDYTFSHFKDNKYGEWYGYLHRDGTVSTTLKGNIFKGPFHIPRCEMENILQLKEILKK